MVVSRWAHTGNQIVATTPHMAGERGKGKVNPARNPTAGTRSAPEGREGSAGPGTESEPIPLPRSPAVGPGSVRVGARSERSPSRRQRLRDGHLSQASTNEKKKNNRRLTPVDLRQRKQICSLEISSRAKNGSHPWNQCSGELRN